MNYVNFFNLLQTSNHDVSFIYNRSGITIINSKSLF